MRPGHFNGVAQVVSRLFDLVTPDFSYFGEKDFQQVAIIREMVKQLNIPVQVIQVPIVREESGLAMSSRNMRLTDSEKKDAVAISKALFQSKEDMASYSLKETVDRVIAQINEIDSLDVEYFEIVDSVTLQPVDNWSDSENIVGCITVFCGQVRLIDNIIYK